MLGAISGDVIGSVYEFHNIKEYEFPLFTEKSNYTDDSIMSCAVAYWLMNDKKHTHQGLADILVGFGESFPTPMGGYGGGFAAWIFTPQLLRTYGKDNIHLYESKDGRKPYYSCGNGSAMRVSPIGWAFKTLKMTEKIAKISAEVTHNHPEGIKGAQAIAAAIFLARTGKSKEDIRDYIEKKYSYDLHKTWDYWHKTYKWDGSCQGTVPQALICALESKSFVDAIRKAVSIGGDSDTVACITGSVAEAIYGEVPKYISERVLPKIAKGGLLDIYEEFKSKYIDK